MPASSSLIYRVDAPTYAAPRGVSGHTARLWAVVGGWVSGWERGRERGREREREREREI